MCDEHFVLLTISDKRYIAPNRRKLKASLGGYTVRPRPRLRPKSRENRFRSSQEERRCNKRIGRLSVESFGGKAQIGRCLIMFRQRLALSDGEFLHFLGVIGKIVPSTTLLRTVTSPRSRQQLKTIARTLADPRAAACHRICNRVGVN